MILLHLGLLTACLIGRTMYDAAACIKDMRTMNMVFF